ncbi:MAG: hypothetical protein P1U80_03870 [Pseudomonadales bacterium]|nr:hypothetical protein [Pseudomonadales bacterium]
MIDLYSSATPQRSYCGYGDLALGKYFRMVGISIDGLDNLKAWLARVGERPAVIRGSNTPKREPKRGEDIVASSIRTMLV